MSTVGFKDLTGERYGKLKVIRFSEKNNEEKNRYAKFWDCQCDCGNTKSIRQNNLVKENGTRSCGCIRKEQSIDLTGQKFRKLLVIERAEPVGKARNKAWLCQCECGNMTTVAQAELRNKNGTKSCGCLMNLPKPVRDVTGQRFGRLTVIEKAETPKTVKDIYTKYWLCQCDCGESSVVSIYSLTNPNGTTSCGCSRLKYGDLTGQRFERLVVLKEAQPNGKMFYKNEKFWLCQCDCGNTKVFRQGVLTKRKGNTVSCGCAQTQSLPKDFTGDRYGSLTAIRRTDKKRNTLYYWEFRCDCGASENRIPSQVKQNEKNGFVPRCSSCNREAKKENTNLRTYSVYDTNVERIRPNCKLPMNNTSGVKGVRMCKREKRWVAFIGFQKKDYFLGYFDHKEDAIKVRKEAEEMYFGNFLEWYDNLSSDEKMIKASDR